jgi:spore coat polysaccharide biosynthesis protein SpsF (cytidylyltransferase family)
MIGAIIQTRMSSTRLPKKVMKIIDEKPILYHVINQLSNSKYIDHIVVATSTNSEDDVIEKFVKSLGITCFRGKLNDVLDRHYQCAKKYSFDKIVRIPSDKPLIDPEIVDEVIKHSIIGNYDYTSNFHYPLKYNVGTEVEIFSFNSLKNVWANAKNSLDREHLFPYFHNHKNEFSMNFLPNIADLKHLRYTLDRIEDLKLIRKIFSMIKTRPILKKDILELYKKNPRLFDINKNLDPNEGQIRSLGNE